MKSKFVMVDNMEWFNVFGLIFIAVIMIPNVVFAIKCKDGFDMIYMLQRQTAVQFDSWEK